MRAVRFGWSASAGIAIIGPAAAFGVALVASAAWGGDLHLSVTGDPGTLFDLECETTDPGASETKVTFVGPVPYERRFPWNDAACTVRQSSTTGGLHIELRSGGNVTVSRIRSGGGVVTVRFGSKTSRSN